MCGTFQSKFKRNNKVAPAPCPFEQEILKRARIQLEKEKALLKKDVETQIGTSLLYLNTENRRSETPPCIAYDLNLDGQILSRGLKTIGYRKLAKDPKLPVLTREMLLEKQAQVEENRNKQIEKKRKAAFRSTQEKERKSGEEAEKLKKAAKIAEKQVRAAENRQAQIEEVKTKAKKSSNNTRSKLVEAQTFARAQEKLQLSDKKIEEVKANKERVVSKVVNKQRQREARAQKVRQRAAKQIEEEEDCVHVFDYLEVDPYYYASDSESNEDGMWDAGFWDR